MTVSQKVQQKTDKRAAALRDNLKKRKAFVKDTKRSEQDKQAEKKED